MVSKIGFAIAVAASTLLPDEDDDIRREAQKVFDDPEEWLNASNPHFGGRTPNDVIAAGGEDSVRNLLRSIRYLAIS